MAAARLSLLSTTSSDWRDKSKMIEFWVTKICADNDVQAPLSRIHFGFKRSKVKVTRLESVCLSTYTSSAHFISIFTR